MQACLRIAATTAIMLGALGALGACAPQPATGPQAAAAAQPHRYREPSTGSLIGGNDAPDQLGGANDPGFSSHPNGGTSH